MRSVIYTLFGAAFTLTTVWALGTLTLRKVARLLDAWEERVLAVVAGSVYLSAIVFLLGTVGLARKGVFLVIGLVAIFLAFWLGPLKPGRYAFPPLPLALKLVFALGLAGVTAAFFVYSFPAQLTPDILTYRLSQIGRSHGAPGGDAVANLARLFERLLFFAVALSRYSAAAVVNFGLLLCLPLLIFCYGRRIGYPVAGVAAAILTYLTALTGKHDVLAYTQAGATVVLFAWFYALEVWEERRPHRFPVTVAWVALLVLCTAEITHWAGLGNDFPKNAILVFFDTYPWPFWTAFYGLIFVALFVPRARQMLLLTVVAGFPYPGYTGPQAVLPIAPFASLALALAASNLTWFAPAVGRVVRDFLVRIVRTVWAIALYLFHAAVRVARAIWYSAPVRFSFRNLAKVPWYAWVIALIVSPWIVAFSNRSATVGAYFRWEQRWKDRWPAVERLAPVLDRVGLLAPARIQVEPGVSFLLDPRDLVSVSILRSGNWQPEIWDSLATDLSPGAVFLDVGAHIGYFSLKAAPVVGPTGRVIAFEPNPETLKLLRDNVTANNASNVVVEPIACTDREQTLTFYAAPIENTGASSLARKNANVSEKEAPRSYQVQGRPIDDVIRELHLTRVDAMKVDVEGAEVYVLRGSVQTLKRFHPKIVIEVVASQIENMGTSVAELLSILKDAGYNRGRAITSTDWEWTVAKPPEEISAR